MAEAKEKQKVEIHWFSYIIYYSVLFFAHWFGSARFDVDGDGDFDPEDVEAYFHDHTHLQKNFKKSKKLHPDERAEHREKLNAARAEKGEHHARLQDIIKKHGVQKALAMKGEQKTEEHLFFESKVEGGKAEEDLIMENLFQKQKYPWFSIFEIVVCFCLAMGAGMIVAATQGGPPFLMKAGLDSVAKGQTDLRISNGDCDNLSWQAWRWLTYQFTHIGFGHVFFNCALICVLGFPLEGMHGHLRMAVMFNLGVLGGAMFYFVTDCHTVVVGCSGGCYALIGVHWADLIMNWSEKKFRWPTVGFLSVLILVDVCSYFFSVSSDSTSHSAHIGGGGAGLLIGIVLVKNIKEEWWEKLFVKAAIFVSLACGIFSLVWLFTQTGGPRSIFDVANDNPGWCWTRRWWNQTYGMKDWVCIRCGTHECIERFDGQKHILGVNYEFCKEAGWYVNDR